MSDLGPINEDVRFDHGAAERLISLCNSTASTVEGQAGSRASWVTTAQRDFAGHFSELFTTNAQTAATDADEIATRLRDVARFTGLLAEEARSEQHRREVAREWQQEQDDRSLLDKGVDTVGGWLGAGEDKPPVGPMPEPSNFSPSPVTPAPRQTPSPGSGGGGGGGTSSARPENLRSFATGSRGANDTIRSKPTSCRSTYDTFVAGCGWGNLEASGVFTGFDKYVDANDEDVRWATTIADAFAAAGGEGVVSTLSNSALAAALRAAGVDATRDDIVVDPPTAYGSPPTSGYADDPVNAATGNFLENEADLAFAGGCAALALTRTYNSFDTGSGAFGPGWSSWTEAGLELTDEAARMRLPDGRVVIFPRLGDGWDRAHGQSLWLTRHDEGLTVADNEGGTWRYTAGGTLLEHRRGAGTAVRLGRDDEGRVTRLEHERGRAIVLTWDDDRVVGAETSEGRRVDYDYDDERRLRAVTTSLGTRRYAWDDAGLIVSVTDADGVVEAENAYDAQRRVTAQRSRHGRVSRFVYLPGNVTVVSDPDGGRSNTWISDHRGRLIGVVDAHEQRQSTAYDAHGNPVLVTERDGAVTVHEYDERGRRVRTVTPSGADLTYGYDEADRVTTVVTEAGAVTTYDYVGDDRNPSVHTDPEGGRTELTWDGNLLTRMVDPTGVTLTFTHDEHGDLVGTTNALGDTARLERDASGRVVAAVTPSGHRSTYRYGSHGLPVEQRDAEGARWTFDYSTAGRLTARIDPTGARTEVEYGPDGSEARTIDPLGRAITRHLDDLGNLSSAELPDGSVWRFSHDALSRLVATTDPTGADWTREYDRTGSLVATVDPTGVRRAVSHDRQARSVGVDDGAGVMGTRFDSLGRMTASEQADGSVAMATYDRCGRPVELLDPEGGLTRITRDPAGRPVSITSPSGAVTHQEYDACGRLAASVDPTGARTTWHYDADGRVVRQVLPSGETVRTDYDRCGRVVVRWIPGRGPARYRYDPAGRMVESSDTWNGRRRFRYDAAGQLVVVTNGNSGVTRYDYDANGRAVAITDPLGHTTRREFDAMNRCVAETDPLGRTTRAGYDAAGRIAWQTDPDGHTLSWSYDAAGRQAAAALDGRTVASLERDLRGRRVTVTDHTRPDGRPLRHRLEWDRRGRLVSRGRDDQTIRWSYDTDGRRESMTTPDGQTTTYARDAAGRLVAVEHPLLGRATIERDASGRVASAAAGQTLQTWERRDGFVVGHVVTDREGARRTEVVRGDDGRVTAVARDGGRTEYTYDEARQLVESRVVNQYGGSFSSWRYDLAGRLVSETLDGHSREFTHDAAGQLVSALDPEGRRVTHTYDGAGRRTRTAISDGTTRDYRWGAIGRLTGVLDTMPDGATHGMTFHVDALGELAEVDGVPTWFDTSEVAAPSLVQAGDVPVVGAGPVTGIGDAWSAPGWRTARADGGDPWEAAPGVALADGLTVGAAGELVLGTGTDTLEWLGARVYDPTSRGFLSVDPLDAVVGSGWSANPYSYAGNDPLHAVDPSGLRPLTDGELDTYIESTQGFLHAAGEWASENWEYVAAGAMVIGGAALMFVPVPGAQLVGAGLISAGIDTAVQKATTGQVNWGQVAVSGAAGMIGGGIGGLAARGGMTMGRAVLAGAAGGAVEGTVGGAGVYLLGPGPHTTEGLLAASARGGATGALFGGAGGAAGHAIAPFGRQLDETVPNPNILSGHGGIMPNDPTTVVIPEGTNVRFWTTHGDTISDSLGNRIETGNPPPPVEVAGPGATVPDYVLSEPTGLNIMGNPTTVTQDTRLSQLIGPNMGDVDWAACRYVPGTGC